MLMYIIIPIIVHYAFSEVEYQKALFLVFQLFFCHDESSSLCCLQGPLSR